jgi:DoxX-like family
LANVDKKAVAGGTLSVLVSILFVFSAVMKLTGGPQVTEGMAHLGIPESILMPLAILELTCVVIYLIPPTSVVGAILLTGYIGGAICSHWRVGDPVIMPVAIGIRIWIGLFLREPRLASLIPVRKA